MARIPFNTARGMTDVFLTAPAPFEMEGVTVNVLPLPASLYKLERFCYYYLNRILPPEVAWFQPVIPYVFLMTVNYGRAATDEVNLGSISQNELVMTVPVEWYRKEAGRWVFCDWAAVTPFIFLEDPWALRTGREVFGWPKDMARFDPDSDPWRLQNQRGRNKPFVMRSMVFPQVFQGQSQVPRIILEIEERSYHLLSPPRYLDFSSDVGHLMKKFGEMLSSWFLRESNVPNIFAPYLLLGKARTALGKLKLGDVKLRLSNVNLKQFPSIEDPSKICYQSVNYSDMEVRRLNDMFLLGSLALAKGDLSGGLTVKIHEYRAQPFIESLGIEVVKWDSIPVPDSSSIDVATIKPVLPFGLNLDMQYGRGEVLCWRTRHSPWHVKKPAHYDTWCSSGGSADPPSEGHPLNTTLGAATKTASGPFRYDLTVRVFPLMAAKDKLEKFCKEYLENDFYRFEAWGSYVYMNSWSYERMLSETSDIGAWRDKEVSFDIPVKIYDKKTDKLISLALVTPFNFTNNDVAVITMNEVSGVPTARASIGGGTDSWMDASGPDEAVDRRLLRLKTMLVPSLNLRQPVESRTLVEVIRGDPLPRNDEVGWRKVALNWGREIVQDHVDKVSLKEKSESEFDNLKTLSLELLAGVESINLVSLKQFREIENHEEACYQAIVLNGTRLEHIQDMREIEECIHVRICQYANIPIVKLLGLKVKHTSIGEEAPVDYLQPIRPFWVRAHVHKSLGKRLCWRTEEDGWKENRDVLKNPYFADRDGTKDPLNLGPGILEWLKVYPRYPRQIHDLWVQTLENPGLVEKIPAVGELEDLEKKGISEEQSRERRSAFLSQLEGRKKMSDAEARKAVEEISPQMAIESILSEEWGHLGLSRRKREDQRLDEWYFRKMKKRKSGMRGKDEEVDDTEESNGGFFFHWPKPDFCFPINTIPASLGEEIKGLWIDKLHAWKRFESKWYFSEDWENGEFTIKFYEEYRKSPLRDLLP